MGVAEGVCEVAGEVMAHYDDKLFKRAAAGPLTADEIGSIVGCYAADAVTRLRNRRDIRVTVVGHLSRRQGQMGPAKKLYRIERAKPITGPYCCGYCEQQRQLDAEYQ